MFPRMGDWLLIVGCGGLGTLCGPARAGLTVTGTGPGPLLTPGWHRGRPAGPRRVLFVCLLSTLTSAILGAAIGAAPELPAFLLLGVVGVVLAVVDAEHHRLPDRITLPAFGIGTALLLGAAAYAAAYGPWLRALAAAAVAAGAFLLLALDRPDGLGLSDVKMAGPLGLHLGWLGWGHVLTGLVLGFVVGAVAALVLLVARRATLRTPIAFGPALLAGTLLAVATGPLFAV
ncbi:hypothetical protein BH18ACT7_BH18ACT7_00310 [soil metagenome]